MWQTFSAHGRGDIPRGRLSAWLIPAATGGGRDRPRVDVEEAAEAPCMAAPAEEENRCCWLWPLDGRGEGDSRTSSRSTEASRSASAAAAAEAEEAAAAAAEVIPKGALASTNFSLLSWVRLRCVALLRCSCCCFWCCCAAASEAAAASVPPEK